MIIERTMSSHYPLSYRQPRGGLYTCLVAFAAVWWTGCLGKDSTSTAANAKQQRTRPTRIVGQGQLLPADGLIRLAATPGDVVDEIAVAVGDSVIAGQRLITLRSLRLRQSQLTAIDRRYADAQQQQANAIQAAKLRLEAAELKLRQVDAQQAALTRQTASMELAKQQVSTAKQILTRLENISADPLTKHFVGHIELDRQRLTVDDAELQYRQESEKLTQAKESIEWSRTAAEQERRAALTSLAQAEQSVATQALLAEMEALKLQQQSSYLEAPRTAHVVAINARVGEAAAQFPLVELAEASSTVCSVEVLETDAALVQPGQLATLSSPALPKKLHGQVLRRERLVGRPQLPPADPLAIADYRSARVIVKLDSDDALVASEWLQLQVTVEIELKATSRDNLSETGADALQSGAKP